jgi:hypothetical protein
MMIIELEVKELEKTVQIGPKCTTKQRESEQKKRKMVRSGAKRFNKLTRVCNTNKQQFVCSIHSTLIGNGRPPPKNE